MSADETVTTEATTKRYRPSGYPRFGSLSRIVEQIRIGESVLDVGCSEGYLAQRLPHNPVWGVDGNVRALNVAAESCVAVAHADLNRLQERVFTEDFDVLVFADVLEHLLEPDEVLTHFAAYLRPGGRAIVSVPNIAHARVRLALARGRFEYSDYGVMDRTHLHFYTFASAQELLRRTGYEIVRTVGTSHRFGPLVGLPSLRGLLSLQVVVTGVRKLTAS